MATRETILSDQDRAILDAAARMGFYTEDVANAKTYIQNHDKLNLTTTPPGNYGNWEAMAVGTAIGAVPGGGTPTVHTYGKPCFDGKYVYFSPWYCQTLARYNIQKRFTDTTAWETMSISTLYGSNTYWAQLWDSYFDGRYVYYTTGLAEIPCLYRYDTSLTFSSASSWQWTYAPEPGVKNMKGIGTANLYSGITFDGRYMYYSAWANTVLWRFDTQGSFESGENTSWISMKKAAVADTGYLGSAVVAGRYVYFAPYYQSNWFCRYDTLANDPADFSEYTTNAADGSVTPTHWDWISITTAHASSPSFSTTDIMYEGAVFDGRYVYFAPKYSGTFIRYDTTEAFETSSSWENVSVSTALNAVPPTPRLLFRDAVFDGVYVYFTPASEGAGAPGLQKFARYNTNSSFSSSSAWDMVSLSSIATIYGGDANISYNGAVFDGKYIYFSPRKAANYLRLRVTHSKIVDRYEIRS